MIQDGTRDIALKNVLRTESSGNVEALLPPLEFAALLFLQPLNAPELLECLVFVVVEIDMNRVPDVARDLAPSTLPLVGPGSPPRTAHGVSGSGKEVAGASSAGPAESTTASCVTATEG